MFIKDLIDLNVFTEPIEFLRLNEILKVANHFSKVVHPLILYVKTFKNNYK